VPGLGVEDAEHAVRDQPDLRAALEDRHARDRRIEEPVGLYRAGQVGVVVGPPEGIDRGVAPVRGEGDFADHRPAVGLLDLHGIHLRRDSRDLMRARAPELSGAL
jgi:hypothetical protein